MSREEVVDQIVENIKGQLNEAWQQGKRSQLKQQFEQDLPLHIDFCMLNEATHNYGDIIIRDLDLMELREEITEEENDLIKSLTDLG